MRANHPLARFDPSRVAFYEKENYVAYYQKDWPRLLRVSVGMVKDFYNLSLLQAIYGAYLVAKAEIAFAPFPENNVPLTEAYMQRFFAFIKRVHHLQYDVKELTRREVNWWIVHRRLFGQAENQELVDALADSYALLYGVDPAQMRPAAYHRAKAMLFSDLWVQSGRKLDSPFLVEEEEELAKGYLTLQAALTAPDVTLAEQG